MTTAILPEGCIFYALTVSGGEHAGAVNVYAECPHIPSEFPRDGRPTLHGTRGYQLTPRGWVECHVLDALDPAVGILHRVWIPTEWTAIGAPPELAPVVVHGLDTEAPKG